LGTCIDRFYFGSCCDLGGRAPPAQIVSKPTTPTPVAPETKAPFFPAFECPPGVAWCQNPTGSPGGPNDEAVSQQPAFPNLPSFPGFPFPSTSAPPSEASKPPSLPVEASPPPIDASGQPAQPQYPIIVPGQQPPQGLPQAPGQGSNPTIPGSGSQVPGQSQVPPASNPLPGGENSGLPDITDQSPVPGSAPPNVPSQGGSTGVTPAKPNPPGKANRIILI